MTEQFDPLSPDALKIAIDSGCLHCIVGVITAQQIARGIDVAEAIHNLLQVVAEMARAATAPGQDGETLEALGETLGRHYHRRPRGQGDNAGSRH